MGQCLYGDEKIASASDIYKAIRVYDTRKIEILNEIFSSLYENSLVTAAT